MKPASGRGIVEVPFPRNRRWPRVSLRMLSLPSAAFAAFLANVAEAQESRQITGAATYLPRIALDPDAVLMVEARGVGQSELGRSREPTAGAQVPLPFAVEIPSGLDATLHVGLTRGGQIDWLSAPIEVESGSGDVDLGEIVLRRFRPMGFASAFRCGDRLVRIGFAGDDAILDTGEARIRLVPSEAASGARFEAPDEPGTWFWNRGDAATVSIGGTELPECRITFPPGDDSYTARGNEPFWNATVGDGRMVVTRPDFDDLDLPVTSSELTGSGDIVVEASGPESGLHAVLVRKPERCNDSMSGMPYPETATLSLGDTVLTGCGGDPRALFAGREWVVQDIGGDRVIADARPTMLFDEDGQVTGSGGCNRWFAEYDLTGEGLSIGRAGATMMACPEALMMQERRFFDALGRVFRHDFAGDGALILYGPEGAVIRARPD